MLYVLTYQGVSYTLNSKGQATKHKGETMNENKAILWGLAIAVIGTLLMLGVEATGKGFAAIDRPSADTTLARIQAGDL